MPRPPVAASTDRKANRASGRGADLQKRLTGGGAGIDFNKANVSDALGADADFLQVTANGTGTGGESGYAISFINAASAGGMLWRNETDGPQVWTQTGAGTPVAGLLAIDGLDLAVGQLMKNDGKGAQAFENTTGLTRIGNASRGLHADISGSDPNNVGTKFSTYDVEWLIQYSETIDTLNGFGQPSGITPFRPALKVKWNGSAWEYHIASGAAWVADL